MMIRINLLPVRQVLKQKQGRQALVAYAAAIVLALVANVVWYMDRQSLNEETAMRVQQTSEKIRSLESEIGKELAQVNTLKKEIDEKLAVLEILKKGRMGPVKMLDALSSATPKRVVIKDFEEQSNSVKIRGEATSHEDVAELMATMANIVWTPRGFGVRSKEAETAKPKETSSVRLLSDGSAVPFQESSIVHLFSDILPLKSETVSSGPTALRQKQVVFELKLNANYAL